jgi:4-hydroxy-tetrahydrodipicolinate reductase
MRLLFNGRNGKVGSVLAPALEANGHELVDSLTDADAMVDFTGPDAAAGNIAAAADAGVPCVVGTSGWDLDSARKAPVPVFYAPNFALGAVLMMRLAEEAAAYFERAEIVELHHETKRDAPSGTASATATRLGRETPIHSIRLPGLVAHQEVIFGGTGELLTIRHDATSREAYTAGVLLALEKLSTLPPGLTVGLDALL